MAESFEEQFERLQQELDELIGELAAHRQAAQADSDAPESDDAALSEQVDQMIDESTPEASPEPDHVERAASMGLESVDLDPLLPESAEFEPSPSSSGSVDLNADVDDSTLLDQIDEVLDDLPELESAADLHPTGSETVDPEVVVSDSASAESFDPQDLSDQIAQLLSSDTEGPFEEATTSSEEDSSLPTLDEDFDLQAIIAEVVDEAWAAAKGQDPPAPAPAVPDESLAAELDLSDSAIAEASSPTIGQQFDSNPSDDITAAQDAALTEELDTLLGDDKPSAVPAGEERLGGQLDDLLETVHVSDGSGTPEAADFDTDAGSGLDLMDVGSGSGLLELDFPGGGDMVAQEILGDSLPGDRPPPSKEELHKMIHGDADPAAASVPELEMADDSGQGLEAAQAANAEVDTSDPTIAHSFPPSWDDIGLMGEELSDESEESGFSLMLDKPSDGKESDKEELLPDPEDLERDLEDLINQLPIDAQAPAAKVSDGSDSDPSWSEADDDSLQPQSLGDQEAAQDRPDETMAAMEDVVARSSIDAAHPEMDPALLAVPSEEASDTSGSSLLTTEALTQQIQEMLESAQQQKPGAVAEDPQPVAAAAESAESLLSKVDGGSGLLDMSGEDAGASEAVAAGSAGAGEAVAPTADDIQSLERELEMMLGTISTPSAEPAVDKKAEEASLAKEAEAAAVVQTVEAVHQQAATEAASAAAAPISRAESSASVTGGLEAALDPIAAGEKPISRAGAIGWMLIRLIKSAFYAMSNALEFINNFIPNPVIRDMLGVIGVANLVLGTYLLLSVNVGPTVAMYTSAVLTAPCLALFFYLFRHHDVEEVVGG